MGTDVYSTRKPTKEVLFMGITPMTVFTMQDAYRARGPWPGNPDYAPYMRIVGRTASLAKTAAEHHIREGNRVFVYGAFEEGGVVYEVEGDLVPHSCYSSQEPANCKKIGYIFKVGGRWTIEKTCPGHDWNYKASRGDEPAKACTRCGRFEYVDAGLQAEYEEKYPEAA